MVNLSRDVPRSIPPGAWPHSGESAEQYQVLGVPAHHTHETMQQDVCQELANKLAWVLGSVYRMPYSSKRTLARTVAWQMMQDVITEHGYPSKIGHWPSERGF